MKKKTAKEVKMHKFLACACKSQDFAQIQKHFAQSHNCMTVTFRNSDRQTHTHTQTDRQTLRLYD